MKTLVIDVGGTHVKVLMTGKRTPIKIDSGPDMTPRRMVGDVKVATEGWDFDRVSIGFPGPVKDDRPLHEPWNLGKGWVGFNFQRAFGKPVKIINDAAMQALGSYDGGNMLFLGLGTGLGSTMVHEGMLIPLRASAHLPYQDGESYETWLGNARDARSRQEAVAQACARGDRLVYGGAASRLRGARRRQCAPREGSATVCATRQQRERVQGRLPHVGAVRHI